MDFIDKFNMVDDQTKLSFLISILHTDRELQEKFDDYIHGGDEVSNILSVTEFEMEIQNYQDDIASRFKQIDLEDPDIDDYDSGRSRYMKHWEMCEDACQQELQTVIDHYLAISIERLKCQDISGMYAVLIGLFIACDETELHDPVPIFHNVNEYLLDTIPYTYSLVNDKIEYAIVSEPEIQNVLVLIIDYCYQNYKEDALFLSIFQPIVCSLAKKLRKGEGVFAKCSEEIIGEIFPQLNLHLLRLTNQNRKWLSFARKYCSKDSNIAKELLFHYHVTGNWKNFRHLARKLFNSDKHHWATILKPLIDLDRERELYLKVYGHLIISNSDLDLYKKLQPEMSLEQRNQLVDTISNKKFLVRVLEVEKRYEDIKKCVSANMHAYDFVDIMGPIINIYPEYCFGIIRKTILNQLETERGRSVYRRIVGNLKLAAQIEGFELKTRYLIQKICQENSRLSALRDELRIAKLI